MATRKKPSKPKRVRYVVRKVDPIAHADDIASILAANFGSDAGIRPTTFIGMSWWIAFAVKDGLEEPVAVAGMCHSALEEGTFYLNRSCVMAEHRGNGLQKKLIMARVARAKELKGTYATSDSFENPPSANNLINCGFRAYNPQARWRIEGSMYWRLKL